MASPSIALLQERFRHLEKVKERREEKELLKLSSETERISTAQIMHSKTSKLSFQPEMIAPQLRSNLQDPLSLGLNLQTKQDDDLQDRKMLPLTSLWPPNGAGTARTSRSSENSDVDTSLHL
ncbi:hypothetical protein I3842_03G268800 [Carya illinoinensis]|uniref:Uncharacterized protein n=1 Tax=Carya illinoinensis TaxID=32201 RepID=A0A922K2H4_CARIL|nr:hypothetical protein I3842_03G268800 [Carya illinoinensis]